MSFTLTPPVRLWRCPSCDTTDRTQRSDAHTQMHPCAALRGINIPLVEVSSLDDKPDARHVEVAREDYIGDDLNAGPVSAIRTERGDGSNDCTVLAPTAVAAVSFGASTHQFHDPELAKIARVSSSLGASMAWSGSAVFAFAMLQALKAGAGAAATIRLDTDSYKVALYGNNSVTPLNNVTTAALSSYNGAASVWVTANEVGNSGTYAAGGTAVTPITLTQTTNVITFTSSGSPQWTSATISAYGGLVYDTTATSPGSNMGLCFNYFGGQQQVTAGTFTIAWNASGIATFTT